MKKTEFVNPIFIEGKGIHFVFSTRVSHPNTWNDEDVYFEKSEHGENKEADDARRYREWKSDIRRPY